MDFKKEIPLAARITWNNKVLWVFAGVPLLIFNLIQFSNFTAVEDSISLMQVVAMCAVPCLFLIAALTLIPISRAAAILGAYKARSGQALSFDGLFMEGRTYLLKYLGLMLFGGIFGVLIGVILLLVMPLFGTLQGAARILLIVLAILLFPVYVWVAAFIEFSSLSLVLQGRTAIEALGSAWRLLVSKLNSIFKAGLVILLCTYPITYLLGLGYDQLTLPLLTPPSSAANGLLFIALAIVYTLVASVVAVFGSSLWIGLFLHIQPEPDTDTGEE